MKTPQKSPSSKSAKSEKKSSKKTPASGKKKKKIADLENEVIALERTFHYLKFFCR
jgi:hypothetical protein